MLIDHSEGRRAARNCGVQVTGTLGVLESGAEQGLMDLPSALAPLQQNKFRIRAEIIEDLLAKDARRKN